MHLSEVELNAALQAQLEARRQSHRGLMALTLLIVLMFLYLLWLWYSPPQWLSDYVVPGRAIAASYGLLVAILVFLPVALHTAWRHRQAFVGIGRALRTGRVQVAQGALTGMRPRADGVPLSAAPVAPTRYSGGLRWKGTRVDYVLDGKPVPGLLDPPNPDAIVQHEVMDLYTLYPDAQARISFAWGERIARVDYPELPPVRVTDQPMGEDDWVELRRGALKPLAWMVGIFLFLMMLPVGLGAVVGILSLDAYQAFLWLFAAVMLACLSPPCIGPLRKLWLWQQRSRLQTCKRTVRGPVTEVLVTVRTLGRSPEYVRWVRVDGRWYQDAQIPPLRFDARRLHTRGDAELNFLVVDGRERFPLKHHCPLEIGPLPSGAQPA